MTKKYIWIPALAGLLALSACNSSDTEESGTDEQNGGGETTTVQGASETVELEEIPQNIVVLEWVYAENLLALGVDPVGIADLEGYNQWVNVEPELPEDITDVGTRQEPNLEAIAQLEPDLIITASSRHEGISDQLNDIAPTVMFEPYPEEGEGDQYEEMETTFREIASAVDREEEADQVMEDLDNSYEEVAAEISDGGYEGNEILLSQAFSANDTASIRLFTDNSMAVKIMQEIGLENAYDGAEFELYGYTETNVDALEPYQDSDFMYIVQEEDNVFENQLAGNEVWEGLNFVEEDRTYALPGDTWTFGGPLSAEVFAEQVSDSLTGE